MSRDTDLELPEEMSEQPTNFANANPEVWNAYAELGSACSDAGPLDRDTQRLVKLALAIASESEGATHSHVQRALDQDIPPEALKHVAALSIPTIGFPKAMAALSWIEDVTDEESG
ncbi:carboxymuconolactone decarboxylase family protein [Halorubrum vacuolatum]|uniref:Uncharacterized conserved protein YurZ, alkylhydroperoxidase/carboxymuconolactone decarboxylase family n=1 Tax=Halorubrum vacuolatum TaxID=63740 RepID=A0A238X8C1_HALVU|nr:carboxymuconolactone decarboxylase family protein [Halorubrum vacuolatum]SNR54872.1 Uncharacterized conserved protein YurZ, alkylhydroperoxidase/carboxymuconolactone decarboxylase family [Halorubrum vacuolatum]